MTADRDLWIRARPLFEELVELDSARRQSRLDDISRSDSALAATLQSLLLADEADDDPLREYMFAPTRSKSPPVGATTRDPLGIIGQTVSRFRVVDYLAAGGMGVVYRAEDLQLGRAVAMKFPLPHQALSNDVKERFVREARAAALVDHPNLCAIYEIGESPHGLFIAMPLYAGETLKERLDRERSLPVANAIAIIRQVATGLQAAHTRGIVHRDLKPGNIMLLPDGSVRILDFGLAKIRDMSQTKSQATLGTLTYMAPDQIRSDPVDARADLWALGVILYEMLTGAPPFSGDNELSLLNAILHDEATRPSQANPNIPRALDRLIMALLQKDPAHRYDSADALLTDIDAVERGEALSHRIPVWAIATQRRSVRIAAIAVTLFLAFGATGMLTWRLAQSRRVSRTAPPVGTRTVAVLPFANVDRNSKDEYLASGFTDEIISRLSKVRALKIAGLSSVSALLGQGLSPQVVGDRLGATHGIDGSIRVIGDTMQAQVRLTRLSDTQIVWSQKFLAPLSSVLRLEEEIADSIIGHLQPTSARSLKLTRPPTNDLQAYTLYYRGRYAWEQRTPEKFEEALALYNGAVERDPEFALAYAVMAEAYVNMQNFGLMPAREALARADVASAKAIALDTALAEGYAARGQYLSALGSYSNAEAALKRAIAINPSAPWAHHYYALLLTMMGRFDEAKDQLRTTLAIDPLSVPGTSTLAILLAHEGRLGEARAQFRRALQLSPNFVVTLYYFAALEVAHANYDEARNLLERALSIAPNFSGVRGALAVTYRELGRGDEAQRLMAQERSNALDERSRTHYGLALALVGESDSAFAVLRTAQWDIPTLIDLRVDPLLNRFRADPRYAELLARFRLRR